MPEFDELEAARRAHLTALRYCEGGGTEPAPVAAPAEAPASVPAAPGLLSRLAAGLRSIPLQISLKPAPAAGFTTPPMTAGATAPPPATGWLLVGLAAVLVLAAWLAHR